MVENFVKEVNRDFHLDEDKYTKLLIALSEIVYNAIVHANKEDDTKKVIIEEQDSGDKAIFRVSDEGEGFDISNIPDPTDDNNLYNTSGRGIFIAKQLVDEFYYNKTEKGSEFVLVLNK